MNILVVHSDFGGCYNYRCDQPAREMVRQGIDTYFYPTLPIDPHESDLGTLINFVAPFDVVVVQRTTNYMLFWMLRQACDVLGKRLVFETDDDYLNIPFHNPGFGQLGSPQKRAEFIKILQSADGIIVSTEELRRLYYVFNKNIKVFPNNVLRVHYHKDICTFEMLDNNKVAAAKHGGVLQFPSYFIAPDGGRRKLVRVGYTCTPTHRVDFETVSKEWFKFLKKYKGRVVPMYFGDQWFQEKHRRIMGDDNCVYLENQQYAQYINNIRNFDIGIAPLEVNTFNMSKSPIKAIEYASWGIPAVLPNLITYNREFTHRKNCLMYYNRQQFYDSLCELVENPKLRQELGDAARHHVAFNRVEQLHVDERVAFFKELKSQSSELKIFSPVGECA